LKGKAALLIEIVVVFLSHRYFWKQASNDEPPPPCARSRFQAIMHMYSAQKNFNKISQLVFVHNSIYARGHAPKHPALDLAKWPFLTRLLGLGQISEIQT
jgi:hypothetical protein